MPETPNALILRSAAQIRTLVAELREDLAANDYWSCDHPEATEDEIYAYGVDSGLGGEAGAFAASWTPGVALAVADWLDATAARAEGLYELLGIVSTPVNDPVWDAAARVARACLNGEDDDH